MPKKTGRSYTSFSCAVDAEFEDRFRRFLLDYKYKRIGDFVRAAIEEKMKREIKKAEREINQQKNASLFFASNGSQHEPKSQG